MSNPVIDVAREISDEYEDDLLVVEGYTVRAKAVPAAIISEVTKRYPDPEVPLWHNPEYDRDEQNPNDPEYIRKKDLVDRQRGEAMIDSTVMFGIEVVGGIPPKETWLPRLQFLQTLGSIDLSKYDLDDEMVLEFVFKRYIIASVALISYIQKMSAITPEDVEAAGKPFRRKEKRRTN